MTQGHKEEYIALWSCLVSPLNISLGILLILYKKHVLYKKKYDPGKALASFPQQEETTVFRHP